MSGHARTGYSTALQSLSFNFVGSAPPRQKSYLSRTSRRTKGRVVGALDTLITDERTGRVALACATEPGDILTNRLVARVGAVGTVHLATRPGAVPGMDRASAEVWRRHLSERLNPAHTERAFTDTAKNGMQLLLPTDRNWPVGIDDLGEYAPLALWAIGNTDALRTTLVNRVAVIGARASTEYGTEAAASLAGDLAVAARSIVTTGAYGIGTAALRGAHSRDALHHTIAVLPAGLDRLYPAGNEKLLQHAAESGTLLSELPPGSAPTRWRFQQRDLVVAAISKVTIVVEAGARSGTLTAAADAAALGRRVGAVPGRVDNPTSYGTNRLLREGIAKIVTSASDIVDLITGRDRTFEARHITGLSQLAAVRDSTSRNL